jgi:DNA-binding protein Fis
VKFLLDHDVPEDLTYLLQELGHEVLRLRDVLAAGVPRIVAALDDCAGNQIRAANQLGISRARRWGTSSRC